MKPNSYPNLSQIVTRSQKRARQTAMPEIVEPTNSKRQQNIFENSNEFDIRNNEYIASTRENSIRRGIIKEQLKLLIDGLFIGDSNEIDNTLFTKTKFHPDQRSRKIPTHTSELITNISLSIAEKYRAEGPTLDSDINNSICDAISKARDISTAAGESPNDLSLFVFDTETNRLFGDVISIGWIKVDIADNEFQVESKNLILPPKFISFGSERVHKMSIDFIKEQHSLKRTTSEVETALMWLKHALSSKSIIGFNVRYDLDGMKRLFHCHSGVESTKIERLFEKISENYAIDAQDILLIIDPQTRFELNLPLSQTQESEMIASSVFNDISNNGNPIKYLPNKKLVSYAKNFLDMHIDNAHNALYDCLLTLPLFLFATGLRNKILTNEKRLKLECNLTTYRKSIKTSQILNRKLFSNSGGSAVDVQKINDQFLKLNPSIKPSPFISRPLGMTAHRRHIIPKSTLFSLMAVKNNQPDRQHLYKEIASSELFVRTAKNILSKNALKVCEQFLKITDPSENYSDPVLIKAVSSLLTDYERSMDKGLKIRYFEAGESAELIKKLPHSSSIAPARLVKHDDIINMMNIIIYSLFHSLESNQFIGPGCENIVSGRLFHYLEGVEPVALMKLEQSTSKVELSSALKNYLEGLKAFLLNNPSNNTSIFSGLGFDDVFELDTSRKIDGEKMLYFLEVQKSINSFIEFFADFTFDPADCKNKVSTSSQSRSDFIQSLKFFIKQESTLRECCKIEFIESKDISDLKSAHSMMCTKTDSDDITGELSDALEIISNITQNIDSTNIYPKEKSLLHAFVQNIFYNCAIKSEITHVGHSSDHSAKPGILSYENNDNDSIAEARTSFKSFIKSIKDSTWYDLPQNAASAMQNSKLIPAAIKALDLLQTQDTSIAETSQILSQLLIFDDQMSRALDVDRENNPKTPLYSDFIEHLY